MRSASQDKQPAQTGPNAQQKQAVLAQQEQVGHARTSTAGPPPASQGPMGATGQLNTSGFAPGQFRGFRLPPQPPMAMESMFQLFAQMMDKSNDRYDRDRD